jgi:hypothetical protein
MVSSTLKLGISILNGGNAEVQQVTEGQGIGRRARKGRKGENSPCDPQLHLPCPCLCRKCWII